MFIRSLLLSCFFYSTVMAQCVDVYGVDSKEAKRILAKYKPEVGSLIQLMWSGLENDAQGFPSTPRGQSLHKKRQLLIEKIKAQEGYAYVDFDTVYYSTHHYCTTIEIIKQNEQDRLRYLPKPTDKIYPKTHDVMDTMQKYLNLGNTLFITNQIQPTQAQCPVYHCTLGFEHPQLRPYLKLFNTAAVEERQFIINTMNHDPNPERRAMAAYLIAHFQDPNDIVQHLMPHVEDEDDAVRNNVVRVLSLTAQKANITNLDPAPFVHLLGSPFATDRNKALLMLFVLAQSKQTQQYLLHHAASFLLSILEMQQSNQRDFAYSILKTISGQDFGLHRAAWEQWFRRQKVELS